MEFILAGFTSPMSIGATPQSLLFIFPLIVAISVIYKATKLETMETKVFIKETVSLVGSVFVFIIITAIILLIFSWVIGL